MPALDRDSASINIGASADVVFELVSDINLMARFSPELVSCRWLDGADRAAIGARFEAVNKLPAYRPTWSNHPVVVEHDPPHRFAISRTEPFAGTLIWRYRLATDGAFTQLTESYEVTRPLTHVAWFIIDKVFSGGHRQLDLRHGMERTLIAIKATAEEVEGDG